MHGSRRRISNWRHSETRWLSTGMRDHQGPWALGMIEVDRSVLTALSCNSVIGGFPRATAWRLASRGLFAQISKWLWIFPWILVFSIRIWDPNSRLRLFFFYISLFRKTLTLDTLPVNNSLIMKAKKTKKKNIYKNKNKNCTISTCC